MPRFDHFTARFAGGTGSARTATRGDDRAAGAHLGEVLEVVVGHVRRVVREGERAEVAGEARALAGAGRQRGEVGQRLGARAAKGREVVLEAALAPIALAAPRDRIERLEARALFGRHELKRGRKSRLSS